MWVAELVAGSAVVSAVASAAVSVLLWEDYQAINFRNPPSP